MEIKKKADIVIKSLVQMLYESHTAVKGSAEMLQKMASQLNDPSFRYGLSLNEDNIAEKYASNLNDLAAKLLKHAAEIESRELDWDFDKP